MEFNTQFMHFIDRLKMKDISNFAFFRKSEKRTAVAVVATSRYALFCHHADFRCGIVCHQKEKQGDFSPCSLW